MCKIDEVRRLDLAGSAVYWNVVLDASNLILATVKGQTIYLFASCNRSINVEIDWHICMRGQSHLSSGSSPTWYPAVPQLSTSTSIPLSFAMSLRTASPIGERQILP